MWFEELTKRPNSANLSDSKSPPLGKWISYPTIRIDRESNLLEDVYNSEDAMNDIPAIQLHDTKDDLVSLDKRVRQTIKDIGKTGSITMRERRLLSDLALSNPGHSAIVTHELRKHAEGWAEARRFEEDFWYQQTRFCTRAQQAVTCLRNFASKLDCIAKEQARHAA